MTDLNFTAREAIVGWPPGATTWGRSSISSDKDKYTVSLGLALFRGEYNAEFGGLMAASTVMMLPVIILFFLTHTRTFIQGITLTGIKG